MTIAAIRADASSKIGLGHIVRGITIAEALRELGHEPVIVTRKFPLLRSFIASRSTARVEDLEDDEDDSDRIHSLSAGLVILDISSTPHKLVSRLKESGCFVVSFDDLGDGRYLADLVIDANLTTETNPAKLTTTTRYLLGPEYVVIGRECQKLRRRARKFDRLRRIIVSCGGSDPAAATVGIIRGLAALDSELDVDIVIGPAFQHGRELSRAILETHRRFSIIDSPNDLPKRFKAADLGILSGGVTLAEAACVGLPSIVIAQDSIQARNVKPYELAGGVKYLGVAGEDSYGSLGASIRELSDPEKRREMSRSLMTLVDGKGIGRIQEAIKELISP